MGGLGDGAVVGLLLGMGAILLLGLAAGRLMHRIRQPPVVGEILVGIALGPSLLGLLPGDPSAALFTVETRSLLSAVAQLGIVVFLFRVGLDLDPGSLRGGGRAVGTVAAGSVVLPLGLGLGAGFGLADRFATPAGPVAFAVFIGVAMAITALPVLARLLDDAHLMDSTAGRTALAAASINDAVAWLLLAAVLTMVGMNDTGPWQVVLGLGMLALLCLGTRRYLPTLARWARRARRGDQAMTVLVLAGVLISAGLTTAVHLHAALGAFAFGLVLPRRGLNVVVPAVRESADRTALLLVPAFFVVTGLELDLTLLDPDDAVVLLVLLVAACAGKLLGACAGSLLGGQDLRTSGMVGALMNMRGLTELIVLQVGLQAGILDTRMFALLVVVAVITTVMTGPLLATATGLGRHRADLDTARRRGRQRTTRSIPRTPRPE